MTTFAYLHGFGSSPMSSKGTLLAERFDQLGLMLHRPDLNRPSFSQLTFSGGLEAIDAFAAQSPKPLRFVASSMGGYLGARWSELNPGAVDRLVLLCPGFGLSERWPKMMGAEAFEQWERTGSFAFEDGAGNPTEVHWGLIEDARTHPSIPEVCCPTTIVHGVHDETVPIQSSRAYVKAHSDVELVEVEDDHRLADSLDIIFDVCRARFDLRAEA